MHWRAEERMNAIRISPAVEKPLGGPALVVDDGGEQWRHRDLWCPLRKELPQASHRLAAGQVRWGFRVDGDALGQEAIDLVGVAIRGRLH